MCNRRFGSQLKNAKKRSGREASGLWRQCVVRDGWTLGHSCLTSPISRLFTREYGLSSSSMIKS